MRTFYSDPIVNNIRFDIRSRDSDDCSPSADSGVHYLNFNLSLKALNAAAGQKSTASLSKPLQSSAGNRHSLLTPAKALFKLQFPIRRWMNGDTLAGGKKERDCN